MSAARLQLRASAKQLIAHEGSLGTAPPRFGDVLERLRPPLAALTGDSGFSSLVWRALALARVEEQWLASVQLEPSGGTRLSAEVDGIGAAEMASGEIALVAALLELLVTFIGESLTLRLLRDVWPKLPFNTLELEHEAL